jgi:hypothetical protein
MLIHMQGVCHTDRNVKLLHDFKEAWRSFLILISLLIGGVYVAEGITRPVVSVSALTWFHRYIYYWNLQFLNNVIINKN